MEVIVLELLPRLISTEAQEVSQALQHAFKKKGIHVETEVKVQSVERAGEGIIVRVEGEKTFEADCCLVAVGRTLNTQGIGLEKIGVAVQENGIVVVDDKMQTTVDGIYAVGDIASKWWLAHVATHQGLVAADHAAGKDVHMDYRAIPSVIFTHPEIGTVGLSLQEALKQGYQAKASPFPFQALGKAQAALEIEGFAQIVVDEKRDKSWGLKWSGLKLLLSFQKCVWPSPMNSLSNACRKRSMPTPPLLKPGEKLPGSPKGFPSVYLPRL